MAKVKRMVMRRGRGKQESESLADVLKLIWGMLYADVVGTVSCSTGGVSSCAWLGGLAGV